MIHKLSLLELNTSIQEIIKQKFSETVWVIGEISELKINRNGHCYLELIERDSLNDKIIAKARATIWAFTFRMLKPYFKNSTGYELISGIKILIKANVEFHELYGFSLNILDIDPNYTIGDLARKKAEIINQLEEEGGLNMNKDILLPLVPQKIAIISSETAAGYQDFINQLRNNPYNYKFYYKLFPSIMQGNQTEESIISSLEKIFNYEDIFDVVVIIRGGGSQSDLSYFDSYQLAANVAQFPLPVLTGIGHDKDESIVDLVAHTKLKTPTAVAEFIIDKVLEFDNELNYYKEESTELIQDYIDQQKYLLSNYSSLIVPLVKSKIVKRNSQLNLITEKFKNKIQAIFETRNSFFKNRVNMIQYVSKKYINNHNLKIKLSQEILHRNTSFLFKKNQLQLENIESRLNLLKPENILRRGFSITYLNNKIIKDYKDVSENDVVLTKLYKGYLRSSIQKKSANNE